MTHCFLKNCSAPSRFLIALRFIRNDNRLLRYGEVMAVCSANRHHFPCHSSIAVSSRAKARDLYLTCLFFIPFVLLRQFGMTLCSLKICSAPLRFLIALRFIRNDNRLLRYGEVMAVCSANRHHFPCHSSIAVSSRAKARDLSLACLYSSFTSIPSESEGSLSRMSVFFIPFIPGESEGSLSHMSLFFNFFYSCS